MNKKINNLLIQGILSIVLMTSLVNAGFGVGFPYSVTLEPGQEQTYNLVIQNVIDNPEATEIKIQIIQGAEYLTLSQDTISLNPDETKEVQMKIRLTEDADRSPKRVELLLSPVNEASNQNGMVGFTLAVGKAFDINVAEKSNKISTKLMFFFVGLLIVLVLAIIGLFNTAKKRK